MSDSRDLPLALVLTGPTATGKTEAAIALVEALDCDIISVDSAMVYRGMDIGTAKPGPDVLTRAPHRLIDIRDPADTYSAADFRLDALTEMDSISRAGRIPLLTGGTMLYLRTLIEGISRLPAADPVVRKRLGDELEVGGSLAMHARLASIDPESAARIHPNDPQRLMRAMEVYEISGETMTSLQRQPGTPLPWRLYQIGMEVTRRDLLRIRIRERFSAMLREGLIDEVARLYARGDLHADLPSIKAVGYRQMWQYLSGDSSYETAVELAVTATCQLAKRQMTWMRGSHHDCLIDAFGRDTVSQVLKKVESVL